jgi:hypothetical protein
MDDETAAPLATKAPAAGSEEARLLKALEELQKGKAGHPVDPNSPDALSALTGQLEQAAHTSTPAGGAPDATLFGYSMGGLMMGVVLSIIGMGCLRYAKVSSQFIYVVPGVIFLVVPFFVETGWGLTAVLVGVTGLTAIVRRFVTF